MKKHWQILLGCSLVAFPGLARASTGLCDENATTAQACIDAIQASGGVVNDIFHDTNGHDAQHLPTYGVLFNQWGPQCDITSFDGCDGTDTPPYDCPGQYTCASPAVNTFEIASNRVAAVDHKWWHPCRLSNHTLDANGCPQIACVADGDTSGFNPWEGLVFDLGGPSNKVVIFAANDHPPQPCESLEYTVFLSDNPLSQEIILHPTTKGVDPQKWNRAVLSKIFTHGWYDTRTPDPTGHGATCGDTADYAVEDDSFVQEFSLPCGIVFRYAAIVAGNDGLDFPACQYASSEAELDAVAGLTESGAGVCPDADGDHFVSCDCPNAPPVCDCDDNDPMVHPGAPEACDAKKDFNCDGKVGSACPDNEVCYKSICVDECAGEIGSCGPGTSCTTTPDGKLCVPIDCGCPPGQICVSDKCVDACDGVVCPGAQVCQDGKCFDACAGVTCPSGQMCIDGSCAPPCSCFAGNLGCTNPKDSVCDASNQCVSAKCAGKTCPADKPCDSDTGECTDFCGPKIVCPQGQKCEYPQGCVANCDGVSCKAPKTCDPMTGMCVDHSCDNVTCFPPAVCMEGQCVSNSGSGGEGGSGSARPSGSTSSGAGGGQGAGKSGSSSSEGGSFLAGAGDNAPGQTGGCCGVAGDVPEGRGTAAMALLGLGLIVSGRRRRRA